MEKLTEQEIIRRQKMEELKAMGIDPFGHAYERTHKSGQIREEFGELTKEELEEIERAQQEEEENDWIHDDIDFDEYDEYYDN